MITESARVTLLWVAERLRERFSGRIELECYQGGVRAVRIITSLAPGDLAGVRGDMAAADLVPAAGAGRRPGTAAEGGGGEGGLDGGGGKD